MPTESKVVGASQFRVLFTEVLMGTAWARGGHEIGPGGCVTGALQPLPPHHLSTPQGKVSNPLPHPNKEQGGTAPLGLQPEP